MYLHRILRIFSLLIRLNAREPVSFYYNLAVPLVAFFGLSLWSESPSEGLDSSIALLFSISGYTIFTSSVYGVGLTFAGWRENGLFISFCRSANARWVLLGGQIILRALATGIYVLIYLLAACAFHREFSLQWLLILPTSAAILGLFCSFSAVAILMVHVSPSDLAASLNGSVFVFLLLNGLAFHGGIENASLAVINVFNPIFLNVSVLAWIDGSYPTAAELLRIGLSTALFAAVGFVGIARFRPYPVLTRI